MSEGLELFEAVVAASRLSRLVAPFTIRRILLTQGVFPQRMTREELGRVLPSLFQALAMSLDAESLALARRDIEKLARVEVPPPEGPPSSA